MKTPDVGETIDRRYVLRREVARGGMGVVFEAWQRYTRRVVALKLLPAETVKSAEHRNRLLREAHALTAVRHPGFVEVLDAGECPAHGPYVAMEMLEGRTLEGILAAKRRLPVQAAVHLGRAVCEALAIAHLRGVVHRDLKPANVFVARNAVGHEVIKVFDLGVASLDEGGRAYTGDKLTRVGEVLGTPEYMAPEQLQALPVDHRCDIYALGMTLYECVTGELPYTGSYPEVLVKVASRVPIRPAHELRPEVGEDLSAVLAKATARAPKDRYPDALSFARALAEVEPRDAPPGSLLLGTSAPPAPLWDDAKSHRQAAPTAAARPTAVISLVKVKKPQPDEPRRSARAPYVTTVRILLTDGTTVDARCEDISVGGLLVLASTACEDGDKVRVRFALPETGDLVTLPAVCRWSRSTSRRSVVGLEFTALPPDARGVIERYIEARGEVDDDEG